MPVSRVNAAHKIAEKKKPKSPSGSENEEEETKAKAKVNEEHDKKKHDVHDKGKENENKRSGDKRKKDDQEEREHEKAKAAAARRAEEEKKLIAGTEFNYVKFKDLEINKDVSRPATSAYSRRRLKSTQAADPSIRRTANTCTESWRSRSPSSSDCAATLPPGSSSENSVTRSLKRSTTRMSPGRLLSFVPIPAKKRT